MTATLLAFPNPLDRSQRSITLIGVGGTVGDEVRHLGWDEGYVSVNGEVTGDMDRKIEPGDFVAIVRVPHGIIEGIVLNLLISTAISVGMSLLFPPPKPQQERDDETSPTYGFSGVQNNRVEGLPIGWVSGKIKTGGQIINEFVEVRAIPPRSTYRALISLGEGPVADIAGLTVDTPSGAPLTGADIPTQIEINGNPAMNYSGVQAWVRLGTNEQAPIPGFDEVRQTFPIDVGLLSFSSSGADTFAFVPDYSIVDDNEYTAFNDDVWAEYAVTYDFADEDADGFVWVLRMPRGYYRTNTTTGASEPAGLGLQARYIELDGGGTPIATGGYDGDGWVRVQPEGPFSLNQRSPFDYELRGLFFDPQTYTPQLPGSALDVLASGDSLSHALGSGNGYSTGNEISFWSISAWVKLDALTTNGTIVSSLSGNRGFKLSIETSGSTGGGSGNPGSYIPFRRRLRFTIGRGSRTVYLFARSASGVGNGIFESGVGQWVHVGVSYARNSIPALYVNGAQVSAFSTDDANDWDLEWVRTSLQIGGGFNGAVDQVKLYNRNLSAAQMRSEYNSGVGTASSTVGETGVMVFANSFDATGGGADATGLDWWTSTPTVNGGANTGVREGVVLSSSVGTLKRGRYRVELLRTTRTDSRASTSNEVTVATVQAVLSTEFTYPNSPLLGISIDATEQLNDSIPTITTVVQSIGTIWDGNSTTVPSIRNAATRNPAWLALRIVLDKRVGLGRFYTLGDVDLVSFYDWAQYCDGIVYDGRPRLTVANPGASQNFDIFFNDDTLDVNGVERGSLRIEFPFEEFTTLPEEYAVGGFLRLAGFPDETTPGVAVDPNSPAGFGHEILSVTLTGGMWLVNVYWDRLDEGSPWTTDLYLGADILSGGVTDLNGGTVETGSRRFECNAVFDRAGVAWDALLDICAVGRATPVPTGSRLKVRYSHPRSAVGLLSSSNIIEESFECSFTSARTKPNSMTLNILDEDQGYEPVPISVQAPELEAVTNQSFIRQENLQLFGVTDAGQAERHGQHLLAVNRLQIRRGSFRAALDALPYEVGDVLRVSSDILPRGASSRVPARSASNNAGMLSDRRDLTGAAWTASSMTVTADTATEPLHSTGADRLAGTGYLAQAITPNVFREGWHTVSAIVKDAGTDVCAMELVSNRATSSVSFDLTAETATVTDSHDFPAKGGIQSMGSGWFFVWASGFWKAADGAKVPSIVTLRLTVETGTGVHWGDLSATQSEFPSCASPVKMILLDRELTVGAAALTIHHQDVRANLASVGLDASLMPVGVYPAGSPIFSSDTFMTPPSKGDTAIVSSAANELLVELSGVRRDADMSATFEWVEYDADVYTDEAVEDNGGRGGGVRADAGPPDVAAGAGASGAGQVGGGALQNVRPSPPSAVIATSAAVESPSGAVFEEASVSWQLDRSAAQVATGVDVFVRPEVAGQSPDEGWALAATAAAPETGVRFPLPGAVPGAAFDVSVVPVSRRFPRADPARGSRTSLTASGLGWNPEAPDALEVDHAAFLAAYGVSFADGGQDEGRRASRSVRIRRGGWILGQPVLETTRGVFDVRATPDLYDAVGDVTVGELHARVEAPTGALSTEVTASPDISVPAATDAPDISAGAAIEWDTYVSGGWEDAMPAVGDPVLSASFAEHADGYVEFTGAGLTATYTSARDADEAVSVSQSREPRPLFMTAACEAEQVHPYTMDDWEWLLGSLEAQRWSLEGPTYEIAPDSPNCTLEIQFRVNVDGTPSGWGDWRKFAPGIYNVVDVQWRLAATRPDSTFNMRILRFHTKAVIPRRSQVEQTSSALHSRSEII